MALNRDKKIFQKKGILWLSIIAAIILIATIIFFAVISKTKVPEKVLHALNYAKIERKEFNAAIEDMTKIPAFTDDVGVENEWEDIEILISLADSLSRNISSEKLAQFIYAYSNSLKGNSTKTILILKYANPSKLNYLKKLKENLDKSFENKDFENKDVDEILEMPSFTIEESRALSISLGKICASIETLGWQEKKDILSAVNKLTEAENIIEEVSYKDLAKIANLGGIILGSINNDTRNLISSASKFFNFSIDNEKVSLVLDTIPTTLSAISAFLISITSSQIMEELLDIDNLEGRETEFVFAAFISAFWEGAPIVAPIIKDELNLVGDLLFSYGLEESEQLGDFFFLLTLEFPNLTNAQLDRIYKILQWDIKKLTT